MTSLFSTPTVKPAYHGRNFADLPPTIQYWLTGQGKPAFAAAVVPPAFARRYDVVVLLFIDSFGWEFVERYGDQYPFLQRMAQQGQLVKITSQFPSTTAAHVTCIHTGLPVGKSGIYEWQYYEPKLDAVITPLLFSFAGTMQRDTLAATGIDPHELYPRETVYARLAEHGVASYSFGDRDYTPSTFSKIVMRGAHLHSFRTLGEALVNLAEQAATAPTPAYLVLYHGEVDAMCHLYGPDAWQTRAQIDILMHALENWLLPGLRALDADALLVMTADHGHMRASPAETRYLNLDSQLRGVLPWLRTDAAGNVLVPAGSPRDAFLYIRDEYLEEATEFLARALEGYADVIPTRRLLEQSYFGALPVCADLLARLGNLAVLPHPARCVWWYERDRFEQKFYGHHGGLTPTEMEIPLGLLEVGS